jgi:hypothetical protein
MAIQEAYIREKVRTTGVFMDRLLKISKIEPSGFSSTKLLADLIRDTEEMYTIHFGKRRTSQRRSTAHAGTGSQLVVTRGQHFLAFAPDGHRRLTTSPRSDPACI